ncbi:MAG: hypothetical protein ACRDGT_09380 [Candidatus Limnocylindria bacterium]
MTRSLGIGIALVVPLALVVVLALSAIRTEPPAAQPTTSPSPTPAAATVTGPAPQPTPQPTPTGQARGAITGALGYPSQFIPPLTVYAISVADERTFFSVDTPRYPLGTGATPLRPSYTITGVVPGIYYVLAYRNDDDPLEERPGVYSEYVLCGGTASCTDHSLVPVTVRPGETVSRIDVTDWYYPREQTYAPRPR